MPSLGPEFLYVALRFDQNSSDLPLSYVASDILFLHVDLGLLERGVLVLAFPLFPSNTCFNKPILSAHDILA